MLKITAYADRLIDDLDLVDYPERVKTQQRNWIGRSHAVPRWISPRRPAINLRCIPPVRIRCTVLPIWLCRRNIRTLKKWVDKIENLDEVRAYQEEAAKKSDFERTADNCERKDRRPLAGCYGDQPGKWKGNSDLYFGLCTDFLRNRRHHGCTGARYP